MTGAEQLRRQLERLQESLRAFEDPIVEEIPGLRLMQETLRERERHIARQIRKSETASLHVKVEGPAVAQHGAAAGLVTITLSALREATAAAGAAIVAHWQSPPDEVDVRAAVEPHLVSAGTQTSLTLLLTRPPGSLETQLVDPATGAPLGELALRLMLQALQRGTTDDAASEVEELRDVEQALRPIAELLVAFPLTITLSLTGYVVESLTVEVDRAGAQRMLTSATAT